jgi:O-acetyl-ADP-ribose deacetylase
MSTPQKRFSFRRIKVTCIQGDITKIAADAIVNAAYTSLLGGGGVDGAIHRAAGPELLDACRKIGRCKTGQAVITTGGRLPAKFVIHTVGPVWQEGKAATKEALLRDCYRNTLTLVREKDLKTIAFPNISTGIYGFPKAEACIVALNALQEFEETYPEAFESIIFICFDADNYELYQNALDLLPEL